MSAETAYAEALRRIEEARAKESAVLDLWTDLNDLAVIPPEISPLTGLRSLTLNSTQVSDLTPLSPLTGLQILALSSTQVSDLTPLSPLTGLRSLDLNSTQVSDLTPLRPLTGLQSLYLNSTQVSDLTPLRPLTGLQTLYLNSTQVSDLSPLKHLTALRDLMLQDTAVEDLTALAELTRLQDLRLDRSQVLDLRPLSILPFPDVDDFDHGLRFAGTPAARATPELTRLSEIEDHQTRTTETLAYLRELPPYPQPLPWEVPGDTRAIEPEQDVALPLVWTGEKVAFAPGVTGDDSDPVQVSALQEVRALLDELKRLTGNQHEDLYRVAEKLREQVECALSDLDLLSVHLTFQRLARAFDRRSARLRPLDDETTAALGDVVEAVPGLTLADPNVQVLIQRQQENQGHRVTEAQIGAEIDVAAAVAADAALFDAGVIDVADAATDRDADDQLSRARGIVSRNAVIAVGNLFKSQTGQIATGLVTTWLWTNSDVILTAVGYWGPDVRMFITPLIMRANELRLSAEAAAHRLIREDD